MNFLFAFILAVAIQLMLSAIGLHKVVLTFLGGWFLYELCLKAFDRFIE